MDGYEAYQIKPLIRFEKSFADIIKAHYRKDKKARNAFEELIESYIIQIQDNPTSDDISDKEAFPKGSYESEFEFRKIRFNCPGLRGQAKYGRFMYVVYKPKRLVYLMWIYTHAEFGQKNTRPPDEFLKEELKTIKRDIEDADNVKEDIKEADNSD